MKNAKRWGCAVSVIGGLLLGPAGSDLHAGTITTSIVTSVITEDDGGQQVNGVVRNLNGSFDTATTVGCSFKCYNEGESMATAISGYGDLGAIVFAQGIQYAGSGQSQAGATAQATFSDTAMVACSTAGTGCAPDVTIEETLTVSYKMIADTSYATTRVVGQFSSSQASFLLRVDDTLGGPHPASNVVSTTRVVPVGAIFDVEGYLYATATTNCTTYPGCPPAQVQAGDTALFKIQILDPGNFTLVTGSGAPYDGIEHAPEPATVWSLASAAAFLGIIWARRSRRLNQSRKRRWY